MLKVGLISIGAFMVMMGCASNPHEAKDIETKMDKTQDVNEAQVGVKDGEVVVQKKVMMGEELRRLQNEVYRLEDKVYGNRKYGSQGLYGALKKCRRKLSSKKYGGNGKLKWTEPIDRVTDKEDEFEIGVDEKDKIVGVSEEYLKDRIQRFKRYKKILMGREDEYREKLEICDAALESRMYEMKQEKKKSEGESA